MRIIELPVLPRIAFFCLIMVAGLICGSTYISAQVRDSYTHTEDAGYGRKKITIETKFENGDVTIQTRYVDSKGKLESEFSETKKSDGETVWERVAYDLTGQIVDRSQYRADAIGKLTYQLFEHYQHGELHDGDSFYYDASGNIKSHRVYNPATQTYEEAELRATERSPTKGPTATKSQEEQKGQSEASKKFRETVPYGQPAPQTPPMMTPPYGYGMGGYGTGVDDKQKRDEPPPVGIPPYGYGTGGYDPPRPSWPGGPWNLPAPPP
jgi:antitoxin component YwqK of YwqJK toxin-antitoxin module